MIVASSAAKVRMMFITSLVSRSLRLGREAVMFTRTPRAPARLTPSSNGQAIACSAAMRARSMPFATAEHLLELVVEDHDQRIDVRRKLLQALLGGLHALGPLEGERLGHHRHRENA